MSQVAYFVVILFFHVIYSGELLVINKMRNVHHLKSTHLSMLSRHKLSNRITTVRHSFVIYYQYRTVNPLN